jgi:hypothetical protein
MTPNIKKLMIVRHTHIASFQMTEQGHHAVRLLRLAAQ